MAPRPPQACAWCRATGRGAWGRLHTTDLCRVNARGPAVTYWRAADVYRSIRALRARGA
jgi:hypothetical protein